MECSAIEQFEADIRGWDAIVDHRTGSDGDDQTAQWLAETITTTGVEPKLETFPFRRRVLHECSIQIDGEVASGVPLFDGGSTGAQGISAPMTSLALGGRASSGTIALASFSSTGRGVHTRQMQSARMGSAKAMVAYAADEETVPGLALLNAPCYMQPFGIPVLQVATQHQEWLEAAAAKGNGAHITAHITHVEATASNVQTTILGRDPSLSPLVIMTPRSAWWTCTAERAGGIALWLACIRHFAKEPGERDVIFTANTGHELGHVGLKYFLMKRPKLLGGAHAWIHLGANFAAVDSEVRLQASTDFMPLGLDFLAMEGTTPDSTTPVDNRPLGEAENIYDGGGRYLSLLGTNRWFHHPDDRWPDTINMERTFKLNQAMLKIAQTMAGV